MAVTEEQRKETLSRWVIEKGDATIIEEGQENVQLSDYIGRIDWFDIFLTPPADWKYLMSKNTNANISSDDLLDRIKIIQDGKSFKRGELLIQQHSAYEPKKAHSRPNASFILPMPKIGHWDIMKEAREFHQTEEGKASFRRFKEMMNLNVDDDDDSDSDD